MSLTTSHWVRARSAADARRLGREEAYRDGYYGLRVLLVTPDQAQGDWRVALVAQGRRKDPWTEGDDPANVGYHTRVGVRVRTLVPAQGLIRGQHISMPAGLLGTVRGYVGLYRRVRLDERPEGTFIFRPPDLLPLDKSHG